MATSAVVHIHHGSRPGVFLYRHSDGPVVPAQVRTALRRAAAGGCLNDPVYLPRIVFCEMVRDDLDGTLGLGISGERMAGNVEIDVDTLAGTYRVSYGSDESGTVPMARALSGEVLNRFEAEELAPALPPRPARMRPRGGCGCACSSGGFCGGCGHGGCGRR